MSKVCAGCEKVAYPLEQIKCLDKIWHKACFKCEVCKMTLNVKNYKGFDKKPYCQVHYPQPSKFTSVLDTPEIQRATTNSKMISNINYHAEFAKNKGTKISVTDDPVSVQHKQNTETFSQITYKNPERRPSIEMRRPSITDEVRRPSIHEDMRRSSISEENNGSQPTTFSRITSTGSVTAKVTQSNVRPGSIQDYEPGKTDLVIRKPVASTTFYSAGSSQPVVDDSPSPDIRGDADVPHPLARTILLDNANTTNGNGYLSHQEARPTKNEHIPEDNGIHEKKRMTAEETVQDKGMCVRAIYNYVAKDDDEISFMEGDLIINGDPIDDGWMYGTVERTGEYGMLPSNYVEFITDEQ